MSDRVHITKPIIGICFMQVCCAAGVEDREILQVANTENPAGTTNGWVTVIRESDRNYEPHQWPVQCEEFPDRTHFLVVC